MDCSEWGLSLQSTSEVACRKVVHVTSPGGPQGAREGRVLPRSWVVVHHCVGMRRAQVSSSAMARCQVPEVHDSTGDRVPCCVGLHHEQEPEPRDRECHRPPQAEGGHTCRPISILLDKETLANSCLLTLAESAGCRSRDCMAWPGRPGNISARRSCLHRWSRRRAG